MKLASLKEFAEDFYTPKSRPTMPRLRRMAERGDIPAVRQGSRWFVDLHQLEEPDPDVLLKRILQG